MGKRKQRGKQKGNKQKVMLVEWEGLRREGKGRGDGTKEYQWSSLRSYDWSHHASGKLLKWFLLTLIELIFSDSAFYLSLSVQNDEESSIFCKTKITDVSHRVAQYRLLARPTLPNSIDVNFAACHLKEVEAQMQQMQFNGQWPSSPTPLYF